MDFAEQQRKPGKHMIALGVVAVLHILLGYALVNGLATKIVEVVKGPIETKIIEEVKPPPPPPENLPPPPKFAPPPPSFVPPPEVVVTPPPVQQPTITTTTVVPPPAPMVIAPPAPVAPPAPAAPAVSLARAPVMDVSKCEKPVYPAAAQRAEVTGVTSIRFGIDGAGKVTSAEVIKSAGSSREHKMLDRAAVEALSKCPFKPGLDASGQPIGATKLVDYAWNIE